MRFKAEITKEAFPAVMNHFKLLGDLGKLAVIHLDPASVRCAIFLDDNSLSVFSTLDVASHFSDFRCENAYRSDVISLEVKLENLVSALKSGTSAHRYVIRLTKKGDAPLLAFHFQSFDGDMTVVQEVPVKVIRAAEAERYMDPRYDRPTASVELPPGPTRSLVAAADRLKTMNKHVLLQISPSGGDGVGIGAGGDTDLTVGVTSEAVTVRSYFRALQAGVLPGGGSEDEEQGSAGSGEAIAVVPSRLLQRVLRAVSSFTPAGLTVYMAPGRVMMLHAVVPEPEGSGGPRASLTAILGLLDPAAVLGAAAAAGLASRGGGQRLEGEGEVA